MKFTKNYSSEIAALIGEMIDGDYAADFLAKHNMKLEITERSSGHQIITIWLGKGKAERQYSICSWRDNRFSWHHTILGSVAELPSARQNILHQDLELIVATRIEEELSGVDTVKKPRAKRGKGTATTTPKKRTAASKTEPATRKPTTRRNTGEDRPDSKDSTVTETAANKTVTSRGKRTTKKEETIAA